MSPILVRPVREQFEHDRVIRLLQNRWRRRFEVAINAGEESAPLRFGIRTLFPDLMLTTNDRAKKLHSIVEVETNESVNQLEAMAEWVPYARVRAAFHLYVPAAAVDATKRLCAQRKIAVDEIWSYHAVGTQLRFTPVYRAPAGAKKSVRRSAVRTRASAKKAKSRSRTAAARTPARRSVKPSASAKRRAAAKKPARPKRQKRK